MEENKNNHKTAKIVILPALITCALTVFVIFQFFIVWKQFGRVALVETSDKNNEISSKLDEYKTIINKYFLGEVDEEKLEELFAKNIVKERPYKKIDTRIDLTKFN